jgi:hypothetical protein
MLILDMIEILPPLGKYKYDTWRILPVKCYIDNSVRLRSCIRNVNTQHRLEYVTAHRGSPCVLPTMHLASDMDKRDNTVVGPGMQG